MTLVCFRVAMAAAIVAAAARGWPGWTSAALLTAGLASDVYDGVLARRWGVATAYLRRLDSATDVLFYAAALYAGWDRYPTVIGRWGSEIVGLHLLEAGVQGTSLVRWRVAQASHSWAAKAWGLTLWAAFVALLGFGNGSAIPVALAVGYAADLDVLAILLLAPAPPVDVRSAWAAWRWRRTSA